MQFFLCFRVREGCIYPKVQYSSMSYLQGISIINCRPIAVVAIDVGVVFRAHFLFSEQPWLLFIFAHAKPFFATIIRSITRGLCRIVQVNLIVRAHDIWANRRVQTIIILYKSAMISISFTKPGQTCSSHLANTQDVVTFPRGFRQEALLKKLSLELFH